MNELSRTLSLAEKMFLLHYDERTGAQGYVSKRNRIDFSQALACAVIFELVLLGRLKVKGIGKEMYVVTVAHVDYGIKKPVLEEAYQRILVWQNSTISQGKPSVRLSEWVMERNLLGQSNSGMEAVYRHLLEKNIIELRGMNRALTNSSSLAQIRGEATVLSKRIAWNTKRVSSWFNNLSVQAGRTHPDSETTPPARTRRATDFLGKKSRVVRDKAATLPGAASAESKDHAMYDRGQATAAKPGTPATAFQADTYIVKHPFPGAQGEVKLALRRRLNNTLVSFLQFSSVPEDAGIDRNAYKNTDSKIINNKLQSKNRKGVEFLDSVLELGGTMVPADIAAIAAIASALRLPHAFFPVNRKAEGDVLAVESENLAAQTRAFSQMGDKAREYFSRDVQKVLSAVS